jgi:pyruvate/2-oxoglutarate dehydrogenase complex dihydrolipoamide dehydrogenase (E3) component
MAPHIVAREEEDAAQIVQQAMVRDGVNFVFNATAKRVEQRGSDKVIVVDQDGVEREHVGDAILIGIGRSPNVNGLGLEAVGIEFDERAGVQVNDRLQTTNKKVFAAGDVASKYKFTHAADFMARIVIQNALFPSRAKASRLVVPWATYTSPEVAHVGIYPQEAEQQGIAIDTFTQDLADNDRAILTGETEGFVRVHTKKGTDQILGATIVATNAGDMIGEITLAMTHGLGLKKIGSTIHPYPTQAESIRKLGDQYSRTRFTPFVQKLFNRWLAWTR